MGLFSEIFVWWKGQTLGTRLFTMRKGALVGEDEQGNRYFEEKKPRYNGQKRRWVLYNGEAEASRVPPDWHGWLHYTFDEPPTVRPFTVKPWEKEHVPNQTGTPNAYRPAGSLYRSGQRADATGDYEAWQPD